MTLLEVVLAVAVAGFVLSAATSFLVSISSIWAERDNRNFFEDHVDGVSEFLKASFTHAGIEISHSTGNANNSEASPITQQSTQVKNSEDVRAENPQTKDGEPNPGNNNKGDAVAGLIATAEAPIAWKTLPGATGFDDPLLNFQLNYTPPLLVGGEQDPSTKIELFLHHDGAEGLSLLWYSNLQEEVEDLRDLRRTIISPLVTEIRYIYWDDRFERWEEVDEPEEGDGSDEYILPRYLKLVFDYQGERRERIITLPVPIRSALLF